MADNKDGAAGKGSTESGAAGTLTDDKGGAAGTADAGKAGDAGKGGKKDEGAAGAKDDKAGKADAGKGGKADDDTTDDGNKGKDGKAGKESAGNGKDEAPAVYKLEIPKDAKDYLDDSDVTAIAAIAKAEGWTNEQAQEKLEAHADGLAAQSAAWKAETSKDATYGGDNLAETQRLARLALDKVRPADSDSGKQLRRILAKSGYGNNLAIVSFLADLGKLMDEDSSSGGSGGRGAAAGHKAAGKAPEDVLYDKK